MAISIVPKITPALVVQLARWLGRAGLALIPGGASVGGVAETFAEREENERLACEATGVNVLVNHIPLHARAVGEFPTELLVVLAHRQPPISFHRLDDTKLIRDQRLRPCGLGVADHCAIH